MEQLTAVVLAAGRGTRMKSNLPKVLHPLGGRPMMMYALDAVRRSGVAHPLLVVGEDVTPFRAVAGSAPRYVVQRRPLGTGHAVAQALPRLRGRLVYVVYADMPFVSPATLRALREAMAGSAARAAVATGVPGGAHHFGRILRDGQGRFRRIVEDRDATPEERAVREVNVGVYCFRVSEVRRALERIRPTNRQREYYLTDAVNLLAAQDGGVVTVAVADPDEMIGVNSREELAQAERRMRRRILSRVMEAGVTVTDPATTFIDETVRIGEDTIIHPLTLITGKTVIGRGCVIGPGARIHDSVVGGRVRVRDSSLEGARVGDGSVVGPYAHLRPGTVVGRDVEIGNFAEMKAVYVGDRTKVHHKSYLGDARIGADVNIGAGTVTCNYGLDHRKHRTTIGNGAYIGSDSMLVAPVRIGRGAITGAGAVVTKDVPPRSVVVGVPARVIRVLDGRR
ncbi:MAG: UDP-N-acetylglucosamine diphosphorylase/glucosamine-1-phosphate N-acetyltransferase [Bacillati bacterium ANGP1]|uniref:Bifunctional protein GlmU n=1 Tax=Candidatus Segetimicrobium genomatis TaxID=2569760 RepID=A0A537J662_9BACT|nr:MAG: UDP-N-acetylglucosamine diphosphorylase/glucosamine-1-phosphate N-acetyltransferase [Terrabacteria group bacterium ANGP1]